ncbi:MAG TPA: TolC family protein [Bryobacteraceae bacterium]|jgi:outer membrane protein|nr:TolC family protein [Bryobacteraceae bacterium]
MKHVQSSLALLCVLLVSAPQGFAQQNSGQDNSREPQLESERPHWYSTLTRPYEARTVPPVNVSNSSRLDSLVRAGTLYLSLSDAIALALENNLDIELERYEFSLAEADLLRAKAGAAIQGIPTGVQPGIPSGAGSILGSASSGLASVNSPSPLGAGLSYDPTLTGTLNFGHTTNPQSNTVTTGTEALITANKTANFGISQAFPTGGSVSLAYNNIAQEQNSFRNTINPATTSALDLQVTQPLLQGFGLALNNRTIRIAKNNLKAADYVFRQQLLNTVANVVQLYWNLVASNQNVDVKKRALDVSQKLYDDNKKQVEIGTLAPIEIVRAEAQVASDQQALVAAQSAVQQQETVLKSALSRNGLASPTIAEVRIVATDPIRIPEVEAVEPMQDLVSRALDNRPDLAESRIQIDNAQIALKGTRNAMLPTLNAVGDVRSNALAGTQNTIFGPCGTNTTLCEVTPKGLVQSPPIADPFFVGGYGSILGQLFGRNFPTYSIGLNLNIPLGNRAAQANLATATLNLRQNQLQVQRQVNQIRVDVQNAIIAVQQARAQYQAAVKQRVLEEQTVDADQKKLALGATTVFQVIQDQRDLATAAGNEVTAEAAYAAARVQIDLATGMTLQNNNVEFDEAKSGHVSKPPSTLPPADVNRP